MMRDELLAVKSHRSVLGHDLGHHGFDDLAPPLLKISLASSTGFIQVVNMNYYTENP